MNIREATCDDTAAIARVHVDSWHTTYRDLLPADFLARLSYAERENLWKRALCRSPRRSFVYVAEDDAGQIVGFASGGPTQTKNTNVKGELYAIYLLESHQHRGLGRQLFSAVAERLQRDGFKDMLLWVLDANAPAIKFYERLGGKPLRSQPLDIDGTVLSETAYGWDHLDVLSSKRM